MKTYLDEANALMQRLSPETIGYETEGTDSGDGDEGGVGNTVIERPPVLAPADVEKPALPPMYAVMLHNDATTNPLFVVEVLREVFAVGREKAIKIMMAAHTGGKACVEVYSKDMAETRVGQAMAMVTSGGAGQNAANPGSPCELTFTSVQDSDGGAA